MSETANLGVTYIQANQNSKEVTANAAFERLDKAMTATFDANLSSGNVTLTETQYREALQVRVINATVAGRTVTLPQSERITILRNDAANTESVGFLRGTTTLSLAPGETAIARTDGSANGLAVCLLGSSSGGGGGGGGGAVTTFTGLADTPSSYSGQGAKVVRVNTAESALEFATPSGGAFTTLSDAPTSYSGQAAKVVRVNSAENALEFASAPMSSPWVKLTDEAITASALNSFALPTTGYRLFQVKILGAKPASGGGSCIPYVQVSQSGSYITGSTSYQNVRRILQDSGLSGTIEELGRVRMGTNGYLSSTIHPWFATLEIEPALYGRATIAYQSRLITNSPSHAFVDGAAQVISSAGALDGVRFGWDDGQNFQTSGRVIILGLAE